jgi:hypothetical protein
MEFEGITKSSTLKKEFADQWNESFHLFKTGQWEQALNQTFSFINCFELDHDRRNTPLHYAAELNAPLEVIQNMIDRDAWRNVRNANGHKPVDTAILAGNLHLLEILKPVYHPPVPLETLWRIEANFHRMLLDRAEWIITNESLTLPQLEVLLEIPEPEMTFPIPGYYGGFRYWLEFNETEIKLIAKGGTRMAEKSWHYEITDDEIRLIS